MIISISMCSGIAHTTCSGFPSNVLPWTKQLGKGLSCGYFSITSPVKAAAIVAVAGNSINFQGKVLGGVEVRTSLEFYSYEAKYTPGFTEYIIPPEIDKTTYKKAKDVALSAHKALGCSGATRVDLIIDSSGNPYALEVNTIPGMTETSLLPKIAKSAGLEFPMLIEEMLKDAVSRKDRAEK